MDELVYWIWFAACFPYGSPIPNNLLSIYDSPKSVYNADIAEIRKLGMLTENEIKLLNNKSTSQAEKVLKQCNKNGIALLTIYDEAYPSALRSIFAPPVLLYVKGDIAVLNNRLSISIVGTRKPNEYYSFTTEYISYKLARAGCVVVSGCAVGCDTAAHSGAVKANAPTIAVLACGIDIDYPKGSGELKKSIIKAGGALVSEMPPGASPYSRIFPTRNRIIAGLSAGVLISQAPLKSGSTITAEHALEQGKDVFCIPPYSIFDSECLGVVRFIRDGAKAVFSANDILAEYIREYADKLDIQKIKADSVSLDEKAAQDAARLKIRPSFKGKKDAAKKEKKAKKAKGKADDAALPEENADKIRKNQESLANSIDESARIVYNKLDISPKYVDILSVECKIPPQELLPILIELELLGLAEAHSGNRYSLHK